MFKTYMASAGAGKTTNLVAEYLSICLCDDKSLEQYRSILAVTFTNNATAEMKERIVQTLNQFAFLPPEQWGGSETAIFHMILKAQPHLDLAVVRARSERLLADILYDYANFSISTIDSFFQRIVRAFAYELGISMSYEVEVTLDDCFQQTVDLLLGRISNEEPKLRDRILALVEEQMAETGRWRIENQLTSLLYTIYGDETAAVPLHALSQVENREELQNKMAKALKTAREHLLEISKDANAFIDSLGLDPADLVGGRGNGKIYKWFENYSPFAPKCYDAVTKAIDNKESFVKAGVVNGDELNAKIVARYKELTDAYDEYAYHKEITGKTRMLSLLFDLKAIMDEIRERDNKFYLSDTNFKIYSEIQGSDTPFIYEKIGNRYRHFFIDEFQDTSHMQWDNLVPLLQNALSWPNGQVILFGDVKQAIYRFRNGDSKLLSDLSAPETSKEYLKLLPSDPHRSRCVDVPMDTNYRSDGNIVEFNNAFFSALPSLSAFSATAADGSESRLKKLYNTYYQKVVQNTSGRSDGMGSVCIQFMDNSNVKFDYFSEYVTEFVQDALNKGYSQKDIAVLTSSNADGSDLGRVLTEAGYRVISSDSLLLSTSPEVNLLVAAVTYIAHPDDRLARFVIANYVLRKHSGNNDESICQVIDQLIIESDFLKLLSKYGVSLNRHDLANKPLFSILTDLIITFGINDADSFVIALMDNAFDYLQKKNGEIVSFLDWWEQKGSDLALKSPEGLDAITINTIHKSKGLQYPVVILPFTQYKRGNTKTDYWYRTKPEDDVELPYLLLDMSAGLERLGCGDVYDDEVAMSEMDNLNKIYVAQTRAKHLMYIVTGKTTENSKNGNYNIFLDAFVQQNNDSSAPLHFVSEPENPLRFWWGDKEEKKREVKLEKNDNESISQLHCTRFDLRALSSHLRKSESPEQAVGNAVHDFLAAMEHFPQSMEEVEQLRFAPGQMYVDEIRAALRKIVGDTHWRPYFADGVRVLNETAILPTRAMIEEASQNTLSRPQTTYRPDRVVMLENETLVIDYKTGHPTEKARAAYERQVSQYVDLLTQMGCPNVRGEVLYLNSDE